MQDGAVSATGAPPISSTRKIEYLSQPAQVSMTDGYFELASLQHFWVRRRFEVFRKLAGQLVTGSREMAEVGCGHGLLQRQMEETYGREVAGFDLNETGLRHNLSNFSRVCCYDIHARASEFRARFDLVFLWDVIEHIADEDEFMQAVMFHVSPKGKLVVNVPAGEWAFSAYDLAAGHVRRYSAHSLLETARRNLLQVDSWTYWGLPFVPLVALRKLWLSNSCDQKVSYASGFAVGSTTVNSFLGMISNCEPIPQKLAGTSLMAVLQL